MAQRKIFTKHTLYITSSLKQVSIKSKPSILGKMLIFHKKVRIFLQSSSQSSLYENYVIVFRENDIVSMNSRKLAFRTPEPKAHR